MSCFLSRTCLRYSHDSRKGCLSRGIIDVTRQTMREATHCSIRTRGRQHRRVSERASTPSPAHERSAHGHITSEDGEEGDLEPQACDREEERRPEELAEVRGEEGGAQDGVPEDRRPEEHREKGRTSHREEVN